MNVLLALNVQAVEMREVASPISAGEVGAVLVGVAIFLGVCYATQYYLPKIKMWRRIRKMRREDMDTRENKLREYVQDILGDGILKLQVDGKVSNQEAGKVFSWLSDRLDLPDLVPTSHRSEIVKDSIRRRRATTKKEPVPIPGPKPGEAVPFTPPKGRAWKMSK